MSLVDTVVSKYMSILSIEHRPTVKLRSNLGAGWLGRCSWSTRAPNTSLIELQRSILSDERTLERVIAHEMVHHRDYMEMSADTVALLRIGIKPPGHGQSFLEGAQEINAVMGEDFVTVESDKEYSTSKNTKQYFLLIATAYSNRLGYAWAVRISPEAQKHIDKAVADGGRLVKVTDERWTAGKAKIKRFGGLSIPKQGSESETILRKLFETGTE